MTKPFITITKQPLICWVEDMTNKKSSLTLYSCTGANTHSSLLYPTSHILYPSILFFYFLSFLIWTSQTWLHLPDLSLFFSDPPSFSLVSAMAVGAPIFLTSTLVRYTFLQLHSFVVFSFTSQRCFLPLLLHITTPSSSHASFHHIFDIVYVMSRRSLNELSATFFFHFSVERRLPILHFKTLLHSCAYSDRIYMIWFLYKFFTGGKVLMKIPPLKFWPQLF